MRDAPRRGCAWLGTNLSATVQSLLFSSPSGMCRDFVFLRLLLSAVMLLSNQLGSSDSSSSVTGDFRATLWCGSLNCVCTTLLQHQGNANCRACLPEGHTPSSVALTSAILDQSSSFPTSGIRFPGRSLVCCGFVPFPWHLHGPSSEFMNSFLVAHMVQNESHMGSFSPGGEEFSP